jgi:hypothetical protein
MTGQPISMIEQQASHTAPHRSHPDDGDPGFLHIPTRIGQSCDLPVLRNPWSQLGDKM